MLDLLIFGDQKRIMKQIRPHKGLNEQTRQIIRILDSWQASTTPSKIISAWKSAGYEPYVKNNVLFFRINRNLARNVGYYRPDLKAMPNILKKRRHVNNY